MVDSIDIPTLFTDKSEIVTYNYDNIDHLIGSEIDHYEFIDKTWDDEDDKVIFIDEEGRIVSVKQNTFSEVFPIEKLYELRVKRDIIDLFSLIYSKEFIDSSVTGPFSSYSQFVKEHRIEIEHGFK